MVSDYSSVLLVIRESFKGSVWVVQVSAEPGRAAGGTGSWDWTAAPVPPPAPQGPVCSSAVTGVCRLSDVGACPLTCTLGGLALGPGRGSVPAA